jgi:hypothetical protein
VPPTRTHLALVAMREQELPILTSQHGNLDTRSAHQQPQSIARARRARAKHGKLLLSQSREGQGAVVSTCTPEQSSRANRAAHFISMGRFIRRHQASPERTSSRWADSSVHAARKTRAIRMLRSMPRAARRSRLHQRSRRSVHDVLPDEGMREAISRHQWSSVVISLHLTRE